MKTPKAGHRHTLLMYRRTMDRLMRRTLAFGVLLLALWVWSQYLPGPIIFPGEELWYLIGGGFALVFSIFAFFTRFFAYIQACHDHLLLVTPFLRLRISYRRVLSVHPADFHKLVPPENLNWAEERYLSHFYGQTALVVELKAYPMSLRTLRLFLPRAMFSRHTQAMIFLVPDWMALSTEIDVFRGRWQQARGRRVAAPGKMV